MPRKFNFTFIKSDKIKIISLRDRCYSVTIDKINTSTNLRVCWELEWSLIRLRSNYVTLSSRGWNWNLNRFRWSLTVVHLQSKCIKCAEIGSCHYFASYLDRISTNFFGLGCLPFKLFCGLIKWNKIRRNVCLRRSHTVSIFYVWLKAAIWIFCELSDKNCDFSTTQRIFLRTRWYTWSYCNYFCCSCTAMHI